MSRPIETGDFFTWLVGDHTVMFARRIDADEWRPSTHYDTLFRVWRTGEGLYRAAVGNGRVTRLSVPQLSPHVALDECAEWFKRKYG